MKLPFFRNKKDTFIAQVSNDQSLHLFSLGDLLSDYDVVNWSRNRPPDESRVDVIRDFYQNAQISCIPGVISAWKVGKALHVYDGIHRFKAACELGWDDLQILVSILDTRNEERVIQDFQHVNSSNPIPILYLENSDEQKLLIVQQVVERLVADYPHFVSPSRKPQQQNFNRDAVIDMLSEVDFDPHVLGIERCIYDQLMILNGLAAKHVQRKGIKCPQKCVMSNFFLFYLGTETIKTHLEQKCKEFAARESGHSMVVSL